MATCTLKGTGEIDTITVKGYDASGVEVPLTGYIEEYMPLLVIEPPQLANGVQATAYVESLYANGAIAVLEIGDPGYGYTSPPSITIDSPPWQQPVVRASPYVQSCTNITGPFHKTTGNLVVRAPPYDTSDIAMYGAGGGLRCDGHVCSPQTPLRSMLCEAFTQVAQGAVGFFVTNTGYAQLVSSFTTFCTEGVKATSGGYTNLSNCVTDFGNLGLKASGYFRNRYALGNVVTGYSSTVGAIQVVSGGAGYTGPTANVSVSGGNANVQATAIAYVDSSVASIVVTNGGSNYTSAPLVTITSPTGRDAVAAASVANGSVTNVIIEEGGSGYYGSNTSVSFSGGGGNGAIATALVGKIYKIDVLSGGSGYRSTPNVTIANPEAAYTPKQIATASAILAGPSTVKMTGFSTITGSLVRRPDIGSIANVNGSWHTVTSVSATANASQFDVSLNPTPAYMDTNQQIPFHFVSFITTGSHVCEYVGSGITYNALPEYGGVPDNGKQVQSISPGRVFYVTTDSNGNTRFGPFFSIEQSTGTVTLASDQLNLNLSALSAIGPFRYNGVPVGQRLQEVTNNDALESQSVPSETVPTVQAVKAYVANRSTPAGGLVNQVLTKASNADRDIAWAYPEGNFGQYATSATYTDFNTAPSLWGWSFVQGNSNGPNTLTSQWYRLLVGIGSDYPKRGTGSYSMELAMPRNAPGAGLWIRSNENGTLGTWTQVGKYIVETTGTAASASAGSLMIDHENSGGASSIVFRSKVNRGSDYAYIQYQDASTIGGAGEAARLLIGTQNDGDDHLCLMPSGSVGINTTSPSTTYKMHVEGNLGVTGTFYQSVDRWQLTTDGKNRFYFANNGRTYYGSQNGYEWRSSGDGTLMTLGNDGNLYCTQNITAFYSDRRLKTNLHPVDNVDWILDGLHVYKFHWNHLGKQLLQKGDDEEEEEIGLIAQDVQEVLPQAARINQAAPGDYLTVDYAKLVPILIESVKSQRDRIHKLETQVNFLLRKVYELDRAQMDETHE